MLGSNLMLNPDAATLLSNLNFLSPDGLCYTFDHRANGYARGEGILAMIVKPMADALRDGNVIRAVIRATGANQDGRTPSLTQPSAEAQEKLIRHVYQKAGLGLQDTRYLEAHGTGTPTGDPIEAKAIGRVFRTHRSPQDPLYLGSIKGNIGHVEAGSGLAGTIRAILALEKGVIPPQALFEDMNSSIDAEFFNIKVPTACVPWPTTGVRRASVNSFSLGGSNAHIILDDAYHYLLNNGLTGYHNCTMLPDDSTAVAINGTTYSSSEHPEQQPSTTLSNGVSWTSPDAARTLSGSSPLLMVWSGADSGAIDRLTTVYEPYLQNKIRGSPRKLNQLAYTLSNRRSRLPWRSFTLLSADQIASGEGLVPLPKAKPVRSANYAPVIAFAFTGQGAQYAAMGLELLQYKIFADTLQRVDSVFASFGSTWSVLDVMRDENKIHSPQFSQPLCTALQIALVELLKSVCVAPSAVLGHSSGEIAAAYAIGALSLESACKVAYYRGIVAKKLKDSVAATPGAMMSVNLPRDEVQSYLYKVGGDKMVVSVHLACINSISNCTLSGDEKDIDQLKQRLDQDEIFAQKINTGVAYHSPAMKAAASQYHELLGGLESGTKLSHGSMISSVTRRLITKVSMLATAQYWVDNLLSPVQFADALQSLDSRENLGVGFERITDILEIGPHSALRRPIQDTLQHLADVGVNAKGKSTKPEGVLRYHSVLQRSKPSLITFLELLGNLFCIGYPVSIEEGNGHHGDKCPPPLVDCPKYPFDLSRRYWHNSRLDKGMRFRPVAKGVMLGKRSHDWNNLRPSFRNWLSLDTMPWLEDHVISTKTICPGTGMLVMAMEGVKHLIESNKVAKSISAFLFPEAHFLRPIPIPENAKTPVEILLSLRPRQETFEKEVAFFESSIFAHDGDSWTECFQATIQVQYEQGVTQVDGGKEHQAETDKYLKLQHEAANCCDKKIDYKTFYQSLRDHGMAYGPSFSILRDIRWDGQHTSQACIAHDLMLDAGDASPVHPAPLDAMMHVTLAQVSKGMSDSAATFVPRDVYNLWLSTKPWKQGHGSVRATSKIHSNKTAGLEGNIFVCDEEDTLLLSAERVVMACVSLDDDGLHDNQGPNLIYKIDRKPLLSQLEGHDLQRLCAPRPISLTDIEQQWSNRLEAALRHSAEDALGCLSSLNFDTSTLPNHLKTFIQALKSRYGDGTQYDKADIRQELARCVEFNPGWDLYAEAGRHLESLLRNETEPLELLTSSQVANRSYPLLFSKLADDRLRNFLDLASHEKPGLRILEIGSGTGGLTTSVLSIFRDLEKSTGSIHFAEYTYTDISPAFFEAARTTFAQVADRIVFQKLDIEKSPETQGFEAGSYDIILAGSVLHATSRLEVSMSNVRALLKPGGYFVNLEITQVNLAKALVSFGSLPGWWLSTEDWRKDGPLVPEETWDRLARDTGFTGVEASWEDGEGVCLMITKAVETETSAEVLTVQPTIRNQGSLIFVVDANAPDMQTTLAASLLQGQGQSTRVVQLNQVHENTWQHDDVIISLLDVGKSFLLAISEQEFEALRTLIQKAQNLLWVTLPDPSAQEEAVDPRPHMALGFLRSMRYEEPTKELVSLMAGQRALLTVDAADAYIRNVLRICFQDGLASLENELFIQDGLLSVERLIYAADQDDDRRLRIYPTLQKDQILRYDPPTVLSMGTPGMLDTLRLAEAQLPDKLDSEAIEIECRAWPVSFRDVMIALSRYGDASDTSGMGWELSGVVSRVGSKVSELQPGDRVCGAAIAGMQTVVQVPVDMVFKIPDDMSFARSVAALNPLMTAYHGLINLARLKRGDKVLIHAAAGSTGQMAVCVAQQIGAEIFATVGFDEKKQLLVDEFGIPASNIFYSRDTSFQKGIMRETGGRGVDVVLNSLSGDKLKASWACIAPFGRFIEIGKADIGSNSSLPMAHFARNVTFAAVDLVHMAAGDPQGTKDLMRTCLAMLFESNIGQYPKPVHLFPVAEAEKAFRFIQSGKNTGRTIITLEPNDKVSVSTLAMALCKLIFRDLMC